MIIILWVLLTACATTICFLIYELTERDRQLKMMDSQNAAFQDTIDTYREREEFFAKKAEYERGLADGRTTDGLYRQILERHARSEQATIMMHGEEETANA